jgi:MFS transporter, AAHS family, benzoate transport protein
VNTVRATRSWQVIALCSLVTTTEGYDAIVYGAVIPGLLNEPNWQLTKESAGVIGSAVYLGMMVGALIGGRLADRFGRRRFTISAVLLFALATTACAVAAEPWQLATFRVIAGLGMGAVVPAVIALAKENSGEGRTGVTVTIVASGIPVGGTLAALIALGFLELHGWRFMFAVGAAFTFLVLAMVCVALPESFRSRTGAGSTTNGMRALFGAEFRFPSTAFALASFLALLTWYCMNTWLTTLMRELDYPLASALQFSLVLNAGAVIGPILLSFLSPRWGSRAIAACGAALTVLSIGWFMIGSSSSLLLLVLVAAFGVGVNTALNLIAASVADTYPTELRATAVGWCNGIGRLGAIAAPSLGGWVFAAVGPRGVFAALLATASALTVLLVLVAAAGIRTHRAIASDARPMPERSAEAPGTPAM